MLNVSSRLVESAKTVLKHAYPHEIKAVEEGAATVSGIAQRIQAREKNGNGKGKPKRHDVHKGTRYAKPNELMESAVHTLDGLCDGLRAVTLDHP